MSALADQSTMPLWDAWGWALLALVVALTLLVNYLTEQPAYRRRDEPVDLWPVDLDAPVELWPVCDCTGCGYPGRVTVDSFTGKRRVCRGCADEGIAHGWFHAA